MAYYDNDNQHVFIFERQNTSYILTCSNNLNDHRFCQIPYNLSALLGWLTKLQDENRKLKIELGNNNNQQKEY